MKNKLTKKQLEVLELLKLYRYLSRIQLQRLLDHHNKGRISSWLKDLREDGYINWIYLDSARLGKASPALYYLETKGIRTLIKLGLINETAARKLYRDKHCSTSLIEKSQFILKCALDLKTQSNANLNYHLLLPAQYRKVLESSPNLGVIEDLKPDGYIFKEDLEAKTVTTYCLEYIPLSLPLYRKRYRLNKYLMSLELDWGAAEELPIVLLVVDNRNELQYFKRRIVKYLSLSDSSLSFRLTTKDRVLNEHFTSPIWEEYESISESIEG